jgi:hypothetical protein
VGEAEAVVGHAKAVVGEEQNGPTFVELVSRGLEGNGELGRSEFDEIVEGRSAFVKQVVDAVDFVKFVLNPGLGKGAETS